MYIFKESVEGKQKIIHVAETLFVALYGDQLNMFLDDLRYRRFAKATTITIFNMSRISPTRTAFKDYSYRIYM